MRTAGHGHRTQPRRIDVARHRLALFADTSIMVDAEIPADADEPRLKVGSSIERPERLENFQEDVLCQVLGFVVAADESIRDVEHLPPVLTNDLLPRRLIAVETPLDQLVG